MTGINYKPATVLVAIAALAGVLAVSTVVIGSVHKALAETVTITKNIGVNNTGINVPTDTGQKQNCQTVGANSGIGDTTGGSCTASSSDNIQESGGILKK
jgi:hypothetical protein